MRQDRTVQASLFDGFAQHEIGGELKKASKWLDEHPALLGLVAADLRRDGLDHFKAYVWSSVVAYNLTLFVRLRSA